MPQETNRVGCRHPGCTGVIEAAVPMWLTLHGDGAWSLYGVGDEAAEIVCDQDGHNNFTTVLHKSLSTFLDELLPESTWEGSKPLTPGGEPDP